MKSTALAGLILAFALLGSACAPAAKPSRTDAAERAALAKRIDAICARPEGEERQAELDKLKRETGLVLYCGGKQKPGE